MNILKQFHGSILLEALISIVILGLIVTGSFFSYGFVYQRIRSQRRQRQALSLLQGWMEEAIASTYLNAPNAEDIFRNEFESQIEDFYEFDFQNIDPDIDIDNRNGMTTIEIQISLNGLPISLYTELETESEP